MAQALNARMLQVTLSTLREAEAMTRQDVLAAVGAEVADRPDATGDGARPLWRTAFGWMISKAVQVGWIVRRDDGVWELTAAGSAALDTFDEVELDRELGRLYRLFKQATADPAEGREQRRALVGEAVAALGPGDWTSYGDLAELSGLGAQQVANLVSNGTVDGGWRVLRSNGSVSPDFHWSEPERTDSVHDVLRSEGLGFDAGGRADPSRRLTADDFRAVLDLGGGAPGRRAWLVRGSSVDGHDLVHIWLQKGSVSLSASKLRPITPPVARAEIARWVEEDYAHKSYAAREAKTEEFDAFIRRMNPGDLVLTTTQAKVYLGRLVGEPSSTASSDGRSNLRRDADWLNATSPVAYMHLPKPLPARFQNQSDVVDLTEQLAVIEKLAATYERPGPEGPDEPVPELEFPPVSGDVADHLLIDQPWLQEQVDLLWDRRQIILYGPPGTGKTFLAQRVAEHLTEPSAVTLVQFHPSYTYEDFFEGFRPTTGHDGSLRFERRPGPFRRLVDSARENPSQPHILIIDEINRANLAKVFGELYFLLEYRDEQIGLLYSPEQPFELPANVFIIGTMNTADRSIAMVDSAMRRRFGFVELHPDDSPTRELLPRWLARLQTEETVEHALDTPGLLVALNRGIERDLRVGPSYFMRADIYRKADGLDRTWKSAIVPLLREYFVDDPERVHDFGLHALREALGSDGGIEHD